MNLFYSSNNISILILQTIAGIPDRECSMKNRRRSFPQVYPNWLYLQTGSSCYLYFYQLFADVPFPLAERPPDGAKLSFKEKMKLFAQEVKWMHQKNTKFNAISAIFSFKLRYWWESLDSCFRWARTRQEIRQRSRRLKERSTASSELQLYWQWPLVKVIDTDTSGTWDWKALDAEKGSCDVIFRGWSRLKNLEPLILDLDWKSDTRVLKNDMTISLTLQLFWAYLDPSSCSCVHPAFFVSSLQHTFFMYVLSVSSKTYVRCLIYLHLISLVIFFLSQHLCSNIKVFTCHNI